MVSTYLGYFYTIYASACLDGLSYYTIWLYKHAFQLLRLYLTYSLKHGTRYYYYGGTSKMRQLYYHDFSFRLFCNFSQMSDGIIAIHNLYHVAA